MYAVMKPKMPHPRKIGLRTEISRHIYSDNTERALYYGHEPYSDNIMTTICPILTYEDNKKETKLFFSVLQQPFRLDYDYKVEDVGSMIDIIEDSLSEPYNVDLLKILLFGVFKIYDTDLYIRFTSEFEGETLDN